MMHDQAVGALALFADLGHGRSAEALLDKQVFGTIQDGFARGLGISGSPTHQFVPYLLNGQYIVGTGPGLFKGHESAQPLDATLQVGARIHLRNSAVSSDRPRKYLQTENMVLYFSTTLVKTVGDTEFGEEQ
jgi:hypothetical protein